MRCGTQNAAFVCVLSEMRMERAFGEVRWPDDDQYGSAHGIAKGLARGVHYCQQYVYIQVAVMYTLIESRP